MNTPSTVINIFILKIHSFENASSVNIGQNFLADWDHSDKTSKEHRQNHGDPCEFHSTCGFADRKAESGSPSFSRSSFTGGSDGIKHK